MQRELLNNPTPFEARALPRPRAEVSQPHTTCTRMAWCAHTPSLRRCPPGGSTALSYSVAHTFPPHQLLAAGPFSGNPPLVRGAVIEVDAAAIPRERLAPRR